MFCCDGSVDNYHSMTDPGDKNLVKYHLKLKVS